MIDFNDNILYSILNDVNTGIYVIDDSFRIIKANDTFISLLSSNSENINGTSILDWIDDDYKDLYIHFIDTAKKNGTCCSFEIMFTPSDQVVLYLSNDAKYISEESGNLFYIFCKNITRSKLLENNLKKAKYKAQDSEKLKSAFLANLSHEIRTPMNAIIGFSELLLENTSLSEDVIKYVQYINNSGIVLLDLIDNIVDISKIQTGQLAIKKTKTNLDTILYDIYSSYSQLCKSKKGSKVNLIFNKNEKNKHVKLKTDPLRFRQIFSNLLNNALKFTEEGFIEFGYHFFLKDGLQQIEFYVKDSGVGFTIKNQDLIFDRFYKVEEDNLKLYRGAGLGLTISKSLVNILGGEIWASSKLGQGSKFSFTIPLTDFEITENTTSELIDSTKSDLKLKGCRVLVAEDEDINFIYIEELLKKYELKLVRAKNGQDAIKIFSENSFDMVLMDIKMPVMDGYDAMKHIKELNSEIPVIAQTAFALAGEKEKILNSGFDDYISKPIKPNILVEIMEKYIVNVDK